MAALFVEKGVEKVITRKDRFNALFAQILAEGADLKIEINNPNLPQREMIINPNANVTAKVAYYNEAYNDDMCLKRNPEIRMESPSFFYIDDLR